MEGSRKLEALLSRQYGLVRTSGAILVNLQAEGSRSLPLKSFYSPVLTELDYIINDKTQEMCTFIGASFKLQPL